MYRRLTLALLVLLFGVAVWEAHQAPSFGAGRLGMPAFLQLPPAETEWGSVFTLFFNNLAVAAIGLGLIWAATFYPGRRYQRWVVLGKSGAVVAALGFAALALYEKAHVIGSAAAVLAMQMQKAPALVLAVYALPHALPRLLALLLILTAPPFWLLRSLRVGSLPRSTFEAWVVARRMILPTVALLMVAAVIEVYLTPTVTTWLLQLP